jgi:hypothetical protein
LRITDEEERSDDPDIRSFWAVQGILLYRRGACFPARKRLPSGGNAHCTINPAKWWEEQLGRAAHPNGTIRYEFRLAYIKAGQMKEKLLQRL